MNTEALNKLELLPPEKQKEIEDFIEYLFNKYHQKQNGNAEEIQSKRQKNLGRLKGKIWMSEDFNDTPEDFKEYT